MPNNSLTLNIGATAQEEPMKIYEITTQEILTKTFTLHAESEEQAWEMAENDLYADGIDLEDMYTEYEEIEEINERVTTTN